MRDMRNAYDILVGNLMEYITMCLGMFQPIHRSSSGPPVHVSP